MAGVCELRVEQTDGTLVAKLKITKQPQTESETTMIS
jgi:hypothetical protein